MHPTIHPSTTFASLSHEDSGIYPRSVVRQLPFCLQAPTEGHAMTDVSLVCEEHDPSDGSVHGQLICSKDVFDLPSAERLAGNLQVRIRHLSTSSQMSLVDDRKCAPFCPP